LSVPLATLVSLVTAWDRPSAMKVLSLIATGVGVPVVLNSALMEGVLAV